MLLFVYGTLASHSEHPLARRLRALARARGPAWLRGQRVELGGYPGIVPSEDPAERVRGELYEFDDPDFLAELDRYEGCAEEPPEFVRREVAVEKEAGQWVGAWAYFYVGPPPAGG